MFALDAGKTKPEYGGYGSQDGYGGYKGGYGSEGGYGGYGGYGGSGINLFENSYMQHYAGTKYPFYAPYDPRGYQVVYRPAELLNNYPQPYYGQQPSYKPDSGYGKPDKQSYGGQQG